MAGEAPLHMEWLNHNQTIKAHHHNWVCRPEQLLIVTATHHSNRLISSIKSYYASTSRSSQSIKPNLISCQRNHCVLQAKEVPIISYGHLLDIMHAQRMSCDWSPGVTKGRGFTYTRYDAAVISNCLPILFEPQHIHQKIHKTQTETQIHNKKEIMQRAASTMNKDDPKKEQKQRTTK